MKTITFSIDLKSFLLGVLTLGGMLLLINSTPARQAQPEPATLDNRRFQVVIGDRESIILDTRTGRFIINPNPGYIGQPRWTKGDFEEIQNREKK